MLSTLVYSTVLVSHSAEFCLFEAVYPLPFGHPFSKGERVLSLFQYSAAHFVILSGVKCRMLDHVKAEQ